MLPQQALCKCGQLAPNWAGMHFKWSGELMEWRTVANCPAKEEQRGHWRAELETRGVDSCQQFEQSGQSSH